MSPDKPGVRVGADLARIADVAESLARFGDRYRRRLFTDHELACCPGEPPEAAFGLAARFAAKEATIKVLRPATNSLDWRSIEVRQHPGGWCDLELSGEAARLAEEAGISSLAVSLTHEGDMAAAVVIALLDPAR